MEKKLKKLGNKGFSLVELIIVIAIMAILAGALAPQLIKYIEKTRISNDTQLVQAVAHAYKLALIDEQTNADYSATDHATAALLFAETDLFASAVRETITGSGTGTLPAYDSKYYLAQDITVTVNTTTYVVTATLPPIASPPSYATTITVTE